MPGRPGHRREYLHQQGQDQRNFIETLEPSGDHCYHDPATLVGKSIEQKFEVDVGGSVVAYDTQTNLHEVAYEDEDEHHHFNLLEDMNLRTT